jgi:hypothetical protein
MHKHTHRVDVGAAPHLVRVQNATGIQRAFDVSHEIHAGLAQLTGEVLSLSYADPMLSCACTVEGLGKAHNYV